MKILSKIIEYGLYLLAFTLPIQTRWIIKAGFNEYQTYSLYGTDILLTVILLLFIIREIASPASWQARNDRAEELFIFGLILFAGISIFFAVNKGLALYKFGWLVLGAGLFWLVAKAAYRRVGLVGSLLVGLGLQAILGSWQFLAQATFANKWLGLALHQAADLGTSVVETMGVDGVGERWLRAYGGTDHPNLLGGALAVGVLLLVYNKCQNSKLKTQNYNSNIKANYLKIVYWFFLVIFSAGLFFSFSRAAWLALAAGLVVMLLGAVIKKDWLEQRNILQAVLVSGLIFFILFFQFPNLVMTRLYSGERLEIKSKSERLESIKNSWPIIKNNWVSGVGVGNYTLALERQLPGEQSFFYQPVHNAFILVWAETGILGLIFFISLIIYLFVRLLRRHECMAPRNDMVAILIVLFVIMSLDHWLWSLHFGVLFFWLTLGLTAGLAAKEENKSGCG